MNAKKVILGAVALTACFLAGAGVEHLRQWWVVSGETPELAVEDLVSKPEPRRVVTVRDEAAEREAAALRKKVAELEKALAERRVERAQTPETPKEEPSREERPRRQSWDERMEQMRKEKPEEYAEMQKRRDEFRQTMEQKAAERVDFLAAVDTKNMSDAQRENHEKLLATVARINEIMAQMGQPRAEGDNRDVRHEMGEAMATLGELYTEERRYLFEETAKAVGHSGAEASAFVEHVQTIIDNTTMMPFGGRGGRGGRPPSPGPGNN